MQRVKETEQFLQDTPEADRPRVDALNRLAHLLQSSDTQRALSLAREGISISEQIGYLHGLAESFGKCAICHWYTSEYKQALEEARTSLTLFEQTEDSIGQSTALNTIGIIYRNTGEYSVALEYHNRALKLDNEHSNTETLTVTLNNIAMIYQRMAEYVRALDFLHQSLSLCMKSGHRFAEALTLTNIGSVHLDLKDYQQSIEFHRRSYTIYEKLHNSWGEATSLQHIGNVNAATGNLDDALASYRQSLALRQKINDTMGQAASFYHIGEILRQQNQDTQAISFYKRSLTLRHEIHDLYGEAETLLGFGNVYLNPDSMSQNTILAIEQFTKSLRIATEINARLIMCRAHELLSQAYKQIHFHQKALEHFEKFYFLHQEVGGEHVAHRIKQLEIQRATEAAEAQSASLRQMSAELSTELEKERTKNEQLLRLDKEKTELLSIVSHDLKNPIAAILLNASTLKRYHQRMKPDEVLRHIDQIEDTTTRMKDIVHKLLDMNAITSGIVSLDIREVNMSVVLDTVMKDYKTRALAKSIRLVFESGGEDTFVMADANALRECIENIFSNALKYSPVGKRIVARITAADTMGCRRLEISDEGPGISAEDQKKLFSPFTKLKNKTTGGESSNGLGLSIVKKFVIAMNGKVGIQSEVGKGSSFFIDLPCASSPHSRALSFVQRQSQPLD